MAMKDKLDSAMDRAGDAVQLAAKKAKHYALIAKKKVAIHVEEEKIRKGYTKLGRLYYKDYVTEAEQDMAEYQPLCDEISDSFRKITTLKQELEDAKTDAGEALGEDIVEDADEKDTDITIEINEVAHEEEAAPNEEAAKPEEPEA